MQCAVHAGLKRLDYSDATFCFRATGFAVGWDSAMHWNRHWKFSPLFSFVILAAFFFASSAVADRHDLVATCFVGSMGMTQNRESDPHMIGPPCGFPLSQPNKSTRAPVCEKSQALRWEAFFVDCLGLRVGGLFFFFFFFSPPLCHLLWHLVYFQNAVTMALSSGVSLRATNLPTSSAFCLYFGTLGLGLGGWEAPPSVLKPRFPFSWPARFLSKQANVMEARLDT